ncbi:MAG: DUF4918 family protein [Flammeovirgaceae bacterium]|nr:MAG: DUF4918 family protein [Flammeovirgaceae bacterium]
MLANNILALLKSLNLKTKLPAGIKAMNPYQDSSAFALCRAFYTRFYNDNKPRTLILGINPGRFGGGITGIPFTDPIKLETRCGIKNELPKKAELSADFIYTMISAYGGEKKFYDKFYISAVCPLGFVKDGKNLNYYDSPELQHAVYNFCVQSIQQQINFGLNREICYCLGEGKNFDFLSRLNSEYQFFKQVIPLPHPRFIMQYRRKRVQEYIDRYLEELK